MKAILKDPLLQIANTVLAIGMGLMALGAAVSAFGIPIFLFNRSKVLLALSEKTPAVPTPQAAWLIVGILVLVGIMALGVFAFLQRLRWIVKSVEAGDPFIPENGVRLTMAAWLMLGVQILSWPAQALALRLTTILGEDTGTVSLGVEINGLLLVLTLFILARVFRTGTQMRTELEGTV